MLDSELQQRHAAGKEPELTVGRAEIMTRPMLGHPKPSSTNKQANEALFKR